MWSETFTVQVDDYAGHTWTYETTHARADEDYRTVVDDCAARFGAWTRRADKRVRIVG